MWNAMLTVFGLVMWLVTQALGLGFTGGGHGWYGPFFFSMPLVVLYPLAFIFAFGSKTISSNVEVGILAAVIFLDLMILLHLLSADNDYWLQMWRVEPAGVTVWTACWAGWQVLLVVALLRKWLGKGGAEAG